MNSSVNNASQFQVVNGGGQSGTADQDISFLNFGGGFFGTSAYLLDGHWDTAADWGGVIYVPSMEVVQEAKIQTNSFTAQFGWSTGNMYNVITKSGTSSFHGDAFEFLRNSDLDATSSLITPRAFPGRLSGATSLVLPAAGRYTSPASTSSATRPSSSRITKVCARVLRLP
jgi:hypothetical protein